VLSRYPYPSRERLHQCAAISPRIAELAATFPLLFFALATNYGPLQHRRDAVCRAELGQSLPMVAQALALPLCLKNIPPEACFQCPTWVRWSSAAGRVLGNYIPNKPLQATNWLSSISYAARAADEQFAFWVSKQAFLFRERLDPRLLRPLALYAWHSGQHANRLDQLAKPWSSRFSFGSAVTEAKHWINRLKLLVYFGHEPIADTWVSGGRIGPYEFVPLTTFSLIMQERAHMRNCLDAYADKLANNESRLFGIRYLGTKVATLEISTRGTPSGLPTIVQLKGPGNAGVEVEVRDAARQWFAKQRILRVTTQPISSAKSCAHFRELLTPYRAAHQELDVCQVDALDLRQLDREIAELARCARLSGMPFTRL
jgi:hypothetical protein